MCQYCKEELGEIVHHVEWLTPENINDPKIALDFANLAFVCNTCHNRIKNPKNNKKRYHFDADGQMITPPLQK